MSIDRDLEIPKCWAFNRDGLRCMQQAGHAGNHAHAIEWPDEECFAPIVHQLPKRRPVADERGDEEVSSQRCMICSHPMHARLCPADDCDCKAGIPE